VTREGDLEARGCAVRRRAQEATLETFEMDTLPSCTWQVRTVCTAPRARVNGLVAAMAGNVCSGERNGSMTAESRHERRVEAGWTGDRNGESAGGDAQEYWGGRARTSCP
jgi:hypothetical protein